MVYRTDEDKVRSIVDNTATIDMTPFIRIANRLVSKVDTNDEDNLLDDGDLQELETWLAAHFYAHRDQLLTSKSTSGASGSFQGQTGMFFSSTQYGQTALLLDVTGYLSALQQMAQNGRKKIQMIWLGSTESQSDDYTSIYDGDEDA